MQDSFDHHNQHRAHYHCAHHLYTTTARLADKYTAHSGTTVDSHSCITSTRHRCNQRSRRICQSLADKHHCLSMCLLRQTGSMHAGTLSCTQGNLLRSLCYKRGWCTPRHAHKCHCHSLRDDIKALHNRQHGPLHASHHVTVTVHSAHLKVVAHLVEIEWQGRLVLAVTS